MDQRRERMQNSTLVQVLFEYLLVFDFYLLLVLSVSWFLQAWCLGYPMLSLELDLGLR